MVTIVKLLSVAALLLLLETLMTCTAVSRNSSVPLALRRNLRSRSSRTGSSSDRSSSGSNNNRKSSSARTGSKRASNKKQLFHYSDIPQCRLSYLGEMYKDDKFIMHTFGTLYCEMLRDFRKTRGRKLRMLEIGFGCGHTNEKGGIEGGISARLWKQFFTESSGPGVELYEVEYGPHPPTEQCVKSFIKQHADVCEAVYMGNQADKVFMNDVVAGSGGQYDLIIDDGGHSVFEQKPSFEVLWDHLMPGGLYFIEDLQASNSEDGIIRDLLGWTDALASGRHPARKTSWEAGRDPVGWVTWPSSLPKDMMSVHCHAELCAMRKSYTAPVPQPVGARKRTTAGTGTGTGTGAVTGTGARTGTGTGTVLDPLMGTSSLPYWAVPHCPLVQYGREVGHQSYLTHAYGDLYCEVFRDFRRTKRGGKLRLLEVGFDCQGPGQGQGQEQGQGQGQEQGQGQGQDRTSNRDVGARRTSGTGGTGGVAGGAGGGGASARVWKKYFTDNGPGVQIYGVAKAGAKTGTKTGAKTGARARARAGAEAPRSIATTDATAVPEATRTCAEVFLASNPGVCEGVYVGDTAQPAFLNNLVRETGGKFDIVIDKGVNPPPQLGQLGQGGRQGERQGGRLYAEQRASFDALWPHVRPGGVYVLENLQQSSSKDGMLREVLGWADQLASSRYPTHVNWMWMKNSPISWVQWPMTLPADMIGVHCQGELCAMRKNYTISAA